MLASLGIIGHGSFGAFLETLVIRLAPEIRLRIYAPEEEVDGLRFFSLEDTCATDAVVLAVPIASFEEVLLRILPLLTPTTVLVDISTVKLHTAGLLKKHAGNHAYLAAHPMFGPESYEKRGKEVTGFRIIVTEHTLPEAAYAALVSFLSSCGFEIVVMTSDAHDQHLADTLFLTHFIGQTIARAGFTRTEIDTVSFGFLMDAVESVKNDTKLFADVFRYNPYCKETIARLEQAEEETRSILEADTLY